MADETYGGNNIASIIRGNEHLAVIDERIVEGTGVYPGRAVIKGTADKQVKICTEEDTQVVGIVLEREDKDIDTAFEAGDVVRVLSLRSRGVKVAVPIQANIADIVRGQKLVTSSEFKWKAHPDDLAVSVDSGATTVTSTAANGDITTVSGYRDNLSYIVADESLAKDTSDDIIIEAIL